MKLNTRALCRRVALDESGQILPWVAFLVVFVGCGMGALTIDVGRGVVAQHLLQYSADAAALAGAQALGATTSPLQSDVYSQACQYGGQQVSAGNCTAKGLNSNPALIPNAKMSSGYPALYCSSTVAASGTNCISVTTPTGGTVTANAIKVVETVTVNTWFGSVIGIPNFQLSAGSVAAMRGSTAPLNVAIILDTTGSMNSTDGKTSDCAGKRITCALNGALTLLGNLSPCAGGASCGSVVSGTTNVSNPLDEVSIYTFPGLTSTKAATGDANCSMTMTSPGNKNSTISYYNTTPAPIYQITAFSSDYATSNPTDKNNGATNNYLSSSSLLVDAAGGKTGCSGLQAVGGANTYFAGVIYQAQADLAAQYTARLNAGHQTQNVLIILSDGDAEATPNDIVNANTSATYPGVFNECQQAIDAASAATTAGTKVYTIAYGTQSSGCATDQQNYSVGSGKSKVTNTNPSKLTPCETMKQMASSTATFYSDYVAGGNGGNNDTTCAGVSGSDTSLNDIFKSISIDIGKASPRLLQWGTP
jgi:hypothetical protein